MNELLGLVFCEDEDSNEIGEIVSGEVVKLLSIIAGTIFVFFEFLKLSIKPTNPTILSSDIERSDLNIN